MAHTEEIHNTNEQPIAPPQTKAIWRTFWILLIATILEFAVAFGIPSSMKWTRIWIFVAMTIFKAFYIVGEFMHLKHEVKSLIWTIVIPVVFVIWLIGAMIWEGGSILLVR